MIRELAIHQVRNLKHARLSLDKYNLFVGDNGSGKTSLLESIFLLSRGKSFRHHQPKHYIHHQYDSCTVWAHLDTEHDSYTLALQKHQDATTLLRLDGTPISTQSTLTLRLPVLVIDPSSMALLEEGSNSRRQLLDWLCFHGEAGFYPTWLEYNRLLKQRNALLKSTHAKHTIHAWDAQLSTAAHRLHDYRQAVFERWRTHLDNSIETLLPQYHAQLTIAYQAGFDTKRSLADILAERLEADIELGYTRIGAHRADIAVGIKLTPTDGQRRHEHAINVLSRGEKKLLITALRLSQLPLVCHAQAPSQSLPAVLIDDIDAELDAHAIEILITQLTRLPCQLFITSLNLETAKRLQDKMPNATKLFLLTHGTISTIDSAS